MALAGRVACRGLLAGFVALAVACVGLAGELYDSFVKLQFARIYPLGYRKTPPNSPLMGGIGPTIAFWGDSRAAQWDKSALGCNLRARDLAVGGLTSTQLALQLKVSPLDRDDYAVVQIGINDLHPLGGMQDVRDEVVAQLRANIALIRDELLLRSNTVVLTTVIPPARVPLVRRLTWDPATSQRIRELNELIRSQADGKRVRVLDAHAMLVGRGDYLDDKYVGDFFLHLNDQAYSRLNQQLLALVAAVSPGCR